MKTNGYEFERKLVEIVDRMLGERDKEIKAFCSCVFGYMAKPDNKWQMVKKGDKRTSKPQRLTVEDLFNIANYLGYDVEDFVMKVRTELNQEKSNQSKEFGNACAS